MKTINTLFLSLSLLAMSHTFAQEVSSDSCQGLWKQDWKEWKKEHYNQKFEGSHETIQANGLILIKDCSVAKEIRVNGKVRIENSEMNALVAKGHITLVDSDILNGAQTNGFLLVSNCSISGSLTVGSDKVALIGSTVDSITFRSKSDKTQKLYLSQGTKIKGTITFSSGKGEVHVTDDVEIAGTVEGGVVIKANPEKT
ncbi:MAG: hypothetical protein LLG04_03370 [Parachlamydia sp.]|nr:hypothetical protein [Parachlamydia sp.]